MNIGFIGCVDFSKSALEQLVSMAELGINVSCVMTKAESSFNSDHVDLSDICRREKIDYHLDIGDHQSNLEFFTLHQPDIIYCFGWSYLLKADMLAVAPRGVVGFHPAALPENRGRHPLIWALALGLTETASSFFLMDEGADSGSIISQQPVSIGTDDDASQLYAKVTQTALLQIKEFSQALLNKTLEPKEQDHSKASYWRKRSRVDGLIDWRMPASEIYNLVRALSKPYPGAEFRYKEQLIRVDKARVHGQSVSRNHECGKILEVNGNQILIKCSGGSAIWIEQHSCKSLPNRGEYL